MATILRYKVFSLLRNTTRTCSFSKTKSLIHVRSLATVPEANSLKRQHEFSIHQCLLLVENKINTKGRLTSFELDCIVQSLQNKEELKSYQAMLLIKCCGSVAANEKPEIRAEYAEKVWNTLKASGIALDISHYNTYLKVKVENEQTISPAEFLKTIEDQGLAPNRVTYQYLLTYCCLKGDLAGTTEILEEMRNKNFPLTEEVFNALVLGHCIAGDVQGAEGVLRIMKEKDILITSKTYSMFLCGLAMCNNIEKMRSVMEECSKQNIEIRGSRLMDVIYYLYINGHNDYAEELINGMGEIKYYGDLITLQFRLLHKKHFEGYLKILECISDNENIVERMKLAFRYLGNKEDLETILKFKDACDKKGLNVDVMKNVLYYSLMSNDIEKSFGIMEHIRKSGHRIKDNFFAPLLIKACENKNLEEILHIINTMTYNYACEISSHFLVRNIFSHLKLNERQMMFLLSGLTVQIIPSVVITAALKMCFDRKETEHIKAIQRRYRLPAKINDDLLDSIVRYMKSGSNPLVVTDFLVKWVHERKSEINQKSSEAEKSGTADGDKLNEIQETIDKLVIKIFRNCENIVTQNFLNVIMKESLPISTKVVDLITKKSDDDTAQLREDKFSEEENRAVDEIFKPRENVGGEGSEYWQFSKLRKTENVAEIEKYFNENEKLHDLFGFKKMVECLKSLNRDDLITKYLKKYYEKFSQEEIRTRNLFLESEMVNKGMLKEAIDLIGKRGFFGRSNRLVIVEMFLPIFERGNSDEIKEVLNMNNSLGKDVIRLQDVVDTLAKRGLEETAIKILDILSDDELRTIEIERELIPAVFNKKKVELMEKLIKFLEGNPIYKKDGSELVFSYACSGNIGKGRELLDSGVRAPLQWLKYISVINESGRAKVLENAIAILKGHEYFSKRILYEYLMEEYESDFVNAEKAMDLWVQLQEENIQPTSKFLALLAQILKANGKEVPFQVPLVTESLKLIVPNSLPKTVKEAMNRVNKRFRRRSMFRVLTSLILENKLQEHHINTVLDLNKDLNTQVKSAFEKILSYIEWKKAFDKDELVAHAKKLIGNLDDQSPENILRIFPFIFLTRLTVPIQQSLAYDVSQVFLWVHLQNNPKYREIADILEPAVQKSLRSENLLRRILNAYDEIPFTKETKQIISFLLSKNVFDGYEMKKEAEIILNLRGIDLEETTAVENYQDDDFSFRKALGSETDVQETKTTPESGKSESADIAEVGKKTTEVGQNL